MMPRSAAFPFKRDPSFSSIGGWVGPKAGVDVLKKEKLSLPHRSSNPGTISM
jgi:hypothetical protein